MNGLIGKKIGMTSVFDDAGKFVACTVVEVTPNIVTQVKTQDSDGYYSLQLAAVEAKAKRTSKALLGHFENAGTTPKKKVVEFLEFWEEQKYQIIFRKAEPSNWKKDTIILLIPDQ